MTAEVDATVPVRFTYVGESAHDLRLVDRHRRPIALPRAAVQLVDGEPGFLAEVTLLVPRALAEREGWL